jgi:hypothetical protein
VPNTPRPPEVEAVHGPDGPPPAPRTRLSRGRLVVLGAVLALLVVAALVVRQPADEGGGGPTSAPTPSGEAVLPEDYPFSADSVWRQDISDAPLADNSAEQVARVAQQVADHYDGVAAFNVNRFQVSFYTVGPDQPRVDVHWTDCQKKGYTPQGLKGEDGQFSDVPIPDDAVPAVGTDGQLTIYSPDSDQLWEFWKAERTEDGWQACWGGRIDDASTSRGYFRNGFGAAGTGLALSGGMVWVDDAEAGVIDHALSLQLIDARHWKTFSWPAQRSDGQDRDPDAVQEGTRLRLDPSVDVDALDLNPVAAMIAKAAQTYGFIVTDRAGSVSITAEAGQETAGEADPWPALLGGTKSWDVMQDFPWDRLQALPRNYGKPASTASPSASG